MIVEKWWSWIAGGISADAASYGGRTLERKSERLCCSAHLGWAGHSVLLVPGVQMAVADDGEQWRVLWRQQQQQWRLATISAGQQERGWIVGMVTVFCYEMIWRNDDDDGDADADADDGEIPGFGAHWVAFSQTHSRSSWQLFSESSH